MRVATLLAAGVTALLGTNAAEAATYVMSATCISTCSEAGLSDGDVMRGRVTLDTSAFSPNGFFADASLRDFSVSFGATTISSANALGAHIDGQWGSTRRDIVQFDMIAGTTLFPTVGSTFLLSSVSGLVSTNGWCDDANCDAIGGSNAGLGPVAIAPIPVPPGLLLAATGVIGLAIAARRRQRTI